MFKDLNRVLIYVVGATPIFYLSREKRHVYIFAINDTLMMNNICVNAWIAKISPAKKNLWKVCCAFWWVNYKSSLIRFVWFIYFYKHIKCFTPYIMFYVRANSLVTRTPDPPYLGYGITRVRVVEPLWVLTNHVC